MKKHFLDNTPKNSEYILNKLEDEIQKEIDKEGSTFCKKHQKDCTDLQIIKEK